MRNDIWKNNDDNNCVVSLKWLIWEIVNLKN